MSAQTAEPAPGAADRRLRRGLLAVAVLLLLATALLLMRDEARRPVEVPAPSEGHIVWADVEGWYRRTPEEVALRSPIEWSIDALPIALPHRLGDWQATDRPHDPAVDVWFRAPEVSVERTYRRADGERVWLSLFGSRGSKSFHLFEHTPDTCYPLGGWRIDRFEVARLPLAGPRPLAVNHGEAQLGPDRLVFFYLYLWDSPARDPERGVLSLRLAAPVRHDPATTYALLANDFLPELFAGTLAWSRF
jgi:hypothetical protein